MRTNLWRVLLGATLALGLLSACGETGGEEGDDQAPVNAPLNEGDDEGEGDDD